MLLKMKRLNVKSDDRPQPYNKLLTAKFQTFNCTKRAAKIGKLLVKITIRIDILLSFRNDRIVYLDGIFHSFN